MGLERGDRVRVNSGPDLDRCGRVVLVDRTDGRVLICFDDDLIALLFWRPISMCDVITCNLEFMGV